MLPQKGREQRGVAAEDPPKGVEALFAGTGDRFQLWKRDTYEARQSRLLQEDLARLPDDADMLSLLGPLAPVAPAGT